MGTVPMAIDPLSQESVSMPPPPPRSCSISLLQTPTTVRVAEGPLLPRTQSSQVPRSTSRASCIPSFMPSPRGPLTPGTPGKATGMMKSPSEICAKMAELGATITPEQLKNPTHEVLRPLFQTIVRLFLDPPYDLCPENELYFTQDLQRIIGDTGFTGFGMLDLLEPEPKKTRRILSMLLSFNEFREARMRTYQQALANLTHARDQKDALAQEILTLTAEDEQTERDLADGHEGALEIARREEQLVQQLREKAEAKARSEALTAELNARINTAKDQNVQLAFKAQELKQEIQHLSQGIVNSPARARMEATQAWERVEQGKAELSALDNRCTVAHLVLDKVAKAEKIRETLAEQLKACGHEKRQWKALKLEVLEMRRSMAPGGTGGGMEDQLTQLRGRLGELCEEWARLHGSEQPATRVPREETEVVIQDLQQQVDDIIQQIDAESETNKREVQMLAEAYANMDRNVNSYMASVNRELTQA